MNNSSERGKLAFDGPGTYIIEVQGNLEPSWSDWLGGMQIKTRGGDGQSRVTTLVGNVRDQATLVGILNAIYDMHLPLIKVELVNDR